MEPNCAFVPFDVNFTENLPRPTDWTKCAICQLEAGNKTTRCPANASKNENSAYKTFVNNLTEFKTLGRIPDNLDSRRLDEAGQGIEQTLVSHSAWWHKACYNKFDSHHLERAKKRHADSQNDECPSPVKTRRSNDSTPVPPKSHVCFFCGQQDPLHLSLTNEITTNVSRAATYLRDGDILAKLATMDMVAQEARYHRNCLTGLYNRERSAKGSHTHVTDKVDETKAKVLAEIASYIIEMKEVSETLPVFKLADIIKMYESRLHQLNVDLSTRPQSTRIKKSILRMVPELTEHRQGINVLLIFKDDVGKGIKDSCKNSLESDAFILAKAASIVRREMFESSYAFDGTFSEESQANAVPSTLLTLLNMILEGPNIKDQVHITSNSIGLILGQLIMFNRVKYQRKEKVRSVRHEKTKEAPFPIYLATLIHSRTRSKEIIETLHNLGLSIGYDRFLSISTSLANNVCNAYHEKEVVYPLRFSMNTFLTGAMDNIDHNTSSRSAKDSFHGTGISLTQHPTTEDKNACEKLSYDNDKTSTNIRQLPEFYSDIIPASSKEFSITNITSTAILQIGQNKLINALKDEEKWIDRIESSLNSNNEMQNINVSWSGFHSETTNAQVRPKCTSTLLPLFHEQAHSLAMVRHSMTIVRNAIAKLNPQQVPVMTVDQPLFALAKQVQWRWPDQFGEDKYVIVLGGLHIEKCFLDMLGCWLKGSGWVNIMETAKITTSGRANALLEASHITRTRWAHQVTAAALSVLQRAAYKLYLDSEDGEGPHLTIEQWRDTKRSNPQFVYWDVTMKIELLFLQFVRSLREGDFQLYQQTLKELAPWLFALDRTHYSRWLPVHLRDMSNLAQLNSSVNEEFMHGHFVAQKTENKYSSMALDQNHEQLNEAVKGAGGAIGLTESQPALLRWMIGGPEITRLVNEFEESFKHLPDAKASGKHHEQSKSKQSEFKRDVESLMNVLEEIGNPFSDDSENLVTLDTRRIIEQEVSSSLENIHLTGLKQYEEFVRDRLISRVVPISDTISKNNFKIFRSDQQKSKTRNQYKLDSLKSNCSLFSRLYIACQAREGDLSEFFAHENQAVPPSLTDMGKLRLRQKSDLLERLESTTPANILSDLMPVTEAEVIDGAGLVHMLTPKDVKTFGDYASKIFIPYLQRRLQSLQRLDVVWDRYIANSLKQSTRQNRGSGERRQVSTSTPLPKNWQNFLLVDQNKQELFSFLAERIVKDTSIVTTLDQEVKTSVPEFDVTALSPSSHEEADTRIMLHVADCVSKGFKRISIKTPDTDVVVLAVSITTHMSIDELWISFGTGKNLKYIGAHLIAANVGIEKAKALPMFHSFTGCDTVSSFTSIGKKTCWDIWRVFPSLTASLLELAARPQNISDDVFNVIQRYVILLYSKSSDLHQVNEARKSLFSHSSRSIENIPPTEAALLQHCKRAVYQGAYIWGQTLSKSPTIPCPSLWGWRKLDAGSWDPFWSVLPEAASASRELIRCGCKTACRGQCKCRKNSLPCTALCLCEGGCSDA